MTKPTLLSGIQPSGKLMLGHYLGVIQPWLKLQHDYNCLLPLVDLHAITVRQEPQLLQQNSYEMLAYYLAAGINPEQCTIFIQSQVSQHSELTWLLSCFTYLGELNRMTQYKEKSQVGVQNLNAGLFTYPILMSADILLYQADLVPVGEDQKQHLELCRNLAERINQHYQQTIFKIPAALISDKQTGGRIMALQQPSKKMSKSDSNPNNTLFLSDSAKQLQKKCRQAVTDSEDSIHYDLENKPGISNLLTILSLITNQSIASLEQTYQGKGYGHIKADLAEAVNALLRPLQQQAEQYLEDKSQLDQLLKAGAEKATEIASSTLTQLQQAIGFIRWQPLIKPPAGGLRASYNNTSIKPPINC